MKFLKPLLNVAAIKRPVKPHAHGQNVRPLNKAMTERKTLLKKEFASPDPLNKVYQKKGYDLDAKIRKMKDENR
jgi:hypothetical protein